MFSLFLEYNVRSKFSKTANVSSSTHHTVLDTNFSIVKVIHLIVDFFTKRTRILFRVFGTSCHTLYFKMAAILVFLVYLQISPCCLV